MERDQAIIEAVYTYRALTAAQIEALFFGSDEQPTAERGRVNSRCLYRLQLLYQHGYLFRDEQAQKLSEGRKPLVYFLDTKGAELLAQAQSIPVRDLDWRPSHNDVKQPFLEHLLASNDVRVAFTTTAASHDYHIVEWRDELALRRPQMKDQVTIKGPGGAQARVAVVPDGYCRLDAGSDIFNFFFEIDMRTVTGEASKWGKRDWARKVKVFLEYYRSGLYQKRYHTADMRVLTITTGETRLANLKRITEAAGGKARFWFTTFERMRAADVFHSPIWSISKREDLHAIIGPAEETADEPPR